MEKRDTKSKLAYFEKWQIWIAIIQTIMIIVTFIAALSIGITQNKINQQLLDLNFELSLEITYDMQSERINIHNKGNTNISLWGSKFWNEKAIMQSSGFIIVPDGSYYIITDRLKKLTKLKIANNQQLILPYDIFIETADGIKYTIKTNLYITLVEGKLSINMQTLSRIHGDWLMD